jgi:hypothetical protein
VRLAQLTYHVLTCPIAESRELLCDLVFYSSLISFESLYRVNSIVVLAARHIERVFKTGLIETVCKWVREVER